MIRNSGVLLSYLAPPGTPIWPALLSGLVIGVFLAFICCRLIPSRVLRIGFAVISLALTVWAMLTPLYWWTRIFTTYGTFTFAIAVFVLLDAKEKKEAP